MKKSAGLNKIKTSIFISGTGSNLRSLIKFSTKKNSPIFIKSVISSNNKAKGLILAKKNKIKTKIYISKDKYNNENEILKFLKKDDINLICLAGFMKILSKNFIKKFKGKILNIHPSLLPKYRGLNTHQRALKNKENFSGCTIHLVNSKLDSGQIILQKKVKIYKNDTAVKLGKRILKQEHIMYPKAIKKLLFSL